MARANGCAISVRGRGHGWHPDLQPGARDDANGAGRRISRRRQQHDQSHTDGARGWRRIRAGAGARCRRRASPRRSVARRRRLGCGGKGCGARERAARRRHHAARRRSDRDRRRRQRHGHARQGAARARPPRRLGAARRAGRSSGRRNCRKTISSPTSEAWRNALILDTDTLGRVVISQLDGGLTQTAYALLSDLIAIRRRRPTRPPLPSR